MASPQRENGHTEIANEIMEKLAKTNFNGYESRYLWVLWRKTWGWRKKEDIISNSQFVKETGIKKQHIWRTEQRLINRNIVTKNGYKLSFQKDYTLWKQLPKMVTVTKLGNRVTKLGNRVTKFGGHKRNYTKETITKETEATPSVAEIPKLINLFKDISPTNYHKWFGIPAERKATTELLDMYPLEKFEILISQILPQLNSMPYVGKEAKAFKPTELLRNFDKIIAKIKELQIKGQNSKLNIAIIK